MKKREVGDHISQFYLVRVMKKLTMDTTMPAKFIASFYKMVELIR